MSRLLAPLHLSLALLLVNTLPISRSVLVLLTTLLNSNSTHAFRTG